MTFTASANSNSDPRTARITITYSYTLGGSRGTATADVTIAQSCGDQPVISVSPTGIAAEIEGGIYSFTYTIVNPVSDGELTCSASASWISNIVSNNGTVTFAVEENTSALMRTATIDVAYSYGGDMVSESVTVAQDYKAGANGGDVSDVIGTYTCNGKVVDPSDPYGLAVMDAEWTAKIFANNDYDDYNLYIDGLCYEYEGCYDYYGDHRSSALANYTSNGQIVIPSQVNPYTTMSIGGYNYYFGYVTCIDYIASEGFYLDESGTVPTTFTASGGTWTSDYGVAVMAFASTSLSSMTYLLDSSIPTLTLTKLSSSTNSVEGFSAKVPARTFEDNPNVNFIVR